VPTIDLTDEELAAVTAAVRTAIETDRFPRAPRLDPLRSALTKLQPATAQPIPHPKAPPAKADKSDRGGKRPKRQKARLDGSRPGLGSEAVTLTPAASAIGFMQS
jgi:hypothetical protein